MIFASIILFWLGCSVQAQVKIENIKQNGILFESLGPAYTYQTKWTIITRLTLIDPKEALDFIHFCENMVTSECTHVQDKETSTCAQWHSEITTVTTSIKNQLEEIRVYLGPRRQKRELANAVGRFSKFLFGTMDDQDAADIYNRLNTLENNDKANIHLMHKQMTVLKSTFDTTTSQIHNLSLHQTQMDNKFNALSTKMRTEMIKMSHEMRRLQIQAEKNQVLLFMLTKLQFIHAHISDQFTLINSLHQHRLHPLIISSSTIRKVTDEITNHTQQYLKINDFHLLNQIIEVTSYHDEMGVIIKIKLPLIFNKQYTLEKIHLIPTHIGQHTSVLDINTNYILTNPEKQYMELTQTELERNCKRCNSDVHNYVTICKQSQPKIMDTNTPTCLTTLFFDKTTESNDCQHRIITGNINTLVKLEQPDTWLFVFEKPHKILSTCDKVSTVTTLEKSGVLTLTKPCTFTLGTLELPFEGNHEIELPVRQPKQEFYPILEIPLLNTTDTQNTQTSVITVKPYLDNQLMMLSQGKTIQELDKEITQEEHERNTKIHQNQSHLNSAGISIIIILVILVGLHKFRKYLKQRSPRSSQIHQTIQTPIVLTKQEPLVTTDNSQYIQNQNKYTETSQNMTQMPTKPQVTPEETQHPSKPERTIRIKF